MKDFFSGLYEWFGLNQLYSKDLGDLLRGLDITCSDYIGTPWYVYIGWIMIGLTGLFYALQYHIVDNSRFNKRKHWWIIASGIAVINFFIAFAIPFNILQASDYCSQLKLSGSDCCGFGVSNAIWGVILFGIISTIPIIRRFSTNCRHTTFWKP